MVGVGHFHPAYRPYDEFDHESDSEMEINDQVDGLNLRISHALENFILKKSWPVMSSRITTQMETILDSRTGDIPPENDPEKSPKNPSIRLYSM